MILLSSEIWFPDPEQTHESGIIAVGGDLSPKRLILAYKSGIFPWYSEDEPILWWCPEERMVLFPEKLHISKSMRPYLNKEAFEVTFNQSFEDVITECSKIERKGQKGTWLTKDMIESYIQLYQSGYAQSVEVWRNGRLVGGLYGIYLKRQNIFCGESMFSKVSNASKYAFIKMVEHFQAKGVKLIDCQVYTKHLESLGAEIIDRNEFLRILNKSF
jgi:leucyl/phenylalanyl-tRNA--protein transferase